MKNNTLVLASLVVLIAICSIAASSERKYPPCLGLKGSEAQALDDIYAHVDAPANQRSTSGRVNVVTGTDGGGALTFYGPRNEPTLLILEVRLSDAKETWKYYFDQGKLIYAHGQRTQFGRNKKGEIDQTLESFAGEERYFMKGGRILLFVAKGEELTDHRSTGGKELMEEATSLKAQLKQNNDINIEKWK